MTAADFEEWLLGLDWNPELLAEQKREIASTFGRAYAADVAAGGFLGVAVPSDDDVPNVWRDVVAAFEEKLKPLHRSGPVASLLAQMYCKGSFVAEISDRNRWLLKATLDADPEIAAPLKAKVLKKLAAYTFARPFVCVQAKPARLSVRL